MKTPQNFIWTLALCDDYFSATLSTCFLKLLGLQSLGGFYWLWSCNKSWRTISLIYLGLGLRERYCL